MALTKHDDLWITHDSGCRPLPCQVARGFVWRISAGEDSLLAQEAEWDDDGHPTVPAVEYGYHGLDIPPADATYLCEDGLYGYLVLTDDDEAPAVPEGWTVEPVDLDDDWWYEDDAWRVVKVASVSASRDDHEEAIFAGVA